MKKLMLMCLAIMFTTSVASAYIAESVCEDTGDPNTQSYARLRYDGSTVNWVSDPAHVIHLVVGDHLHGVNHYSDGVTKYDIPDEIPQDATITSAKIRAYQHVNNSGMGSLYMALEGYMDENPFDSPISFASDSPDHVSTYLVSVLDFYDGEQIYEFDITADIAAKVAAGYDWASYAWQHCDAQGNVTPNGPAVPPDISMVGLGLVDPLDEYNLPQEDYPRPTLIIEYIPEPATMVLLALGSLVICRKRK
jgi:hypothetical protein